MKGKIQSFLILIIVVSLMFGVLGCGKAVEEISIIEKNAKGNVKAGSSSNTNNILKNKNNTGGNNALKTVDKNKSNNNTTTNNGSKNSIPTSNSKANNNATTTKNSTVTENTKPIANAGNDQTVKYGSAVILDGSSSSDADGDKLTFSWMFKSKPVGSTLGANPTSYTSEKASFVPDKRGTYVAQLIVKDSKISSDLDTVKVTVLNNDPVANAGLDRTVTEHVKAYLYGGGSSDPDKDTITYSWAVKNIPANSTSGSAITNPTSATANFIPDVTGEYMFSLTITDSQGKSKTDDVKLTAASPKSYKYVSKYEFPSTTDVILAIIGDNNNIYVLNRTKKQVVKLSKTLGASYVLVDGKDGNSDADYWDNGEFDSPEDITLDGHGNLYVVDSKREDFQQFNISDGSYKAKVGTTGTSGDSSTAFNHPCSISADKDYVYVSDFVNKKIKKYGYNLTYHGSPLTSNWVHDIIVDAVTGKKYTLDSLAPSLVVYDSSWNELYNLTPQGDDSFFVDKDGYIYMLDRLSWKKITKYRPDGSYYCTFGNHGHANGELYLPTDIYIDKDGCIYVSESHNVARVQKFEPY